MESLHDPESLRDRDDVEFREMTETLSPVEYEAARDDLERLDSHAVVGVTNDAGEVLLMDDRSHGWTLTAVAVEPDEDWVAAARGEIGELTRIDIGIERPVRARRIDHRKEGEDEPVSTIYNVVFDASPVDAESVVEIPFEDGDEKITELRWFDEVPENVEGPVADDVRLFLN